MSQIDFNTILAISIHDTKNALGMLLSSLDSLFDSYTGECNCDVKHVARLRYEAQRVNSNLIQLLTLYRTSRGLYEPQIMPTPVYEIIEDYCLGNVQLLDHHGVSCEIDCDEELYWPLDGGMITAVLENAITNTVRYTRNKIRVSASERDDWLHLEIEDNGPGYPETMLGCRVVTDDTPIDPKSGRTGLGLYFCMAIAQMHRVNGERSGYLELSNNSALGGGRFCLALPG